MAPADDCQMHLTANVDVATMIALWEFHVDHLLTVHADRVWMTPAELRVWKAAERERFWLSLLTLDTPAIVH